MDSDKKSEDQRFGVLAVSVLFGVVGAGMFQIAWGFGFWATIFLFLLIAAVVAILLTMGRREGIAAVGELKAKATSLAAEEKAPKSTGLAGAGEAPTGTVAMNNPTPATETVHLRETVSLETPSPVPTDTINIATPTPTKETVHVNETVALNTPSPDPTKAAEPAPDSPGDRPGTRPHALDAPREGGADDLKQIKGIGPALEKLCNSLGFFHFDQVAAWSEDEIAWVDQNLEGFKGRVTRDRWVEQARELAASRPDKGD